jgi:hypothetical protein
METKETQLIYFRMAQAMKKIDAIGKDRKNTLQNYQFRGIDDVYNELHSILADNDIFMTSAIINDRHEQLQSKNGGVLLYRILTIKYRFYTNDGSYVETEVMGEAMDSGDKATNKCLSVGHKYALLQTFCIPTADLKDPENESPEIGHIPKVQYVGQTQETKTYTMKPAAQTFEEKTCPMCNGAMWDNRTKKTNPKQPDFKCKDTGCNGVIWPPKTQAKVGAVIQQQQSPIDTLEEMSHENVAEFNMELGEDIKYQNFPV